MDPRWRRQGNVKLEKLCSDDGNGIVYFERISATPDLSTKMPFDRGSGIMTFSNAPGSPKDLRVHKFHLWF